MGCRLLLFWASCSSGTAWAQVHSTGTGRDESTSPEPGPDDRKEVDSRQRSASLRIHTTGSGTGRKEVFYLMTHSTHFIYGYMASDIYGKEPLR